MAAVILLVVLSMTGTAHSEDWPTRPVEVVVASRVGGSLDIMARGLGRFLADRIGVPVVIRNKPGGMTSVAVDALLRGDPDGHTLMVTVSSPYLIGTILNLDVNYGIDDFVVVNDQWSSAEAIHAHRNLRDQSLSAVFEESAREPGKYSVGVFPQSGGHIGFLQLLDALGMPEESFRIVYFDSGSQFRAAFAGGHIDLATMPLESVRGIEGLVDTRAVFAKEAQPGFEAVPTLFQVMGLAESRLEDVPGFIRSVLVSREFAERYPARFQGLVEQLEAIVTSEEFYADMQHQLVGTDWLGPQVSTANLHARFRRFESFLVANRLDE